MRLWFIAALLGVWSALAMAQEAPLSEAQNQQAKELYSRFHCVVCHGQSLADSEARLAQDMRSLIRAKLREGLSAQQIEDFLVARYGASILMEPPLAQDTLALWAAPLLLLALGGWWGWRQCFSIKK